MVQPSQSSRSARVVAIIPAAGRSQRMGRPKPLVPVDGRPMLLATIEPFRAQPGLEVIVVTRSEIAAALDLDAAGVMVVCNDDPDAEMIDSIRLGIRAAQRPGPGPAGWLITPGDQPGLDPADVRRCIERFDADSSRIVIAAHGGRRGHPAIIPAGLSPDIFSPLCDQGLNQLMQRHEERITLVECESPSVTTNINTVADLPARDRPGAG
ncbi:MAG: NTP transferase domain-containing protein [Phycisphaerales bacterium JB039]